MEEERINELLGSVERVDALGSKGGGLEVRPDDGERRGDAGEAAETVVGNGPVGVGGEAKRSRGGVGGGRGRCRAGGWSVRAAGGDTGWGHRGGVTGHLGYRGRAARHGDLPISSRAER